jgi:ABC-type uncharacterized transport system substrate-binding protein
MDEVLPVSFISKETGCTDTIKCYKIGDRHIAEVESRDELDELVSEYLKTNCDTRRRELSKEYQKLAAEKNAEFPYQRYFKTLVI